MRRTNKAIGSATSAYIRTVWDLDLFLTPWFADPQQFRDVLRQCNGFVSGSQVVQFFGRTEYSDSDFDLYVPAETAMAMGCYLLSLGYTFQPRGFDMPDFYSTARILGAEIKFDFRKHRRFFERRDDYGDPNIIRVYYFLHSDRKRELQIIVSRHRNPLWIVMCHHSTAVMNFFTWDRAVSLFPRSTFVDYVGFLAKGRYSTTIRDSLCPWVVKWLRRGFILVSNEDDFPHLKSVRGHRRVYDKKSWIVRCERRDTHGDNIGLVETNLAFEVIRPPMETVFSASGEAAIQIISPSFSEARLDWLYEDAPEEELI
ncbi:hypothetical protein PLICRDRAFT_171381 [Plicaturopsis crispa FD-325 SS-3]|nr:hypothetical protein PLICRDRAFT_171381 [Plicaturopsis crispa FD-325 SS-3]